VLSKSGNDRIRCEKLDEEMAEGTPQKIRAEKFTSVHGNGEGAWKIRLGTVGLHNAYRHGGDAHRPALS